MTRHAVARRAARALRRGVGPPGRRHRLLRHPRQVEARGRARAGLPARGRRREAATRSARSCSTSCRARPSSPRPPTTVVIDATPSSCASGAARSSSLRLNRPDARNALDPGADRAASATAIVEAEADPEIRAVVSPAPATARSARAWTCAPSPSGERAVDGDDADDVRSTGCIEGDGHDPARRARRTARRWPAASSCCSAATSIVASSRGASSGCPR